MDDVTKLNSMESSSTLFDKGIPVRVTKSPGCEDRLIDLTVRIVMGLSKVHRSGKVLRVQLTNELDPFFLYSLEVTEDDFQSLKVEQCILVDFPTFPYKFIELLEHCINPGNHDTPRFQAILHVRTGDSTFSIVEANQFKHLSHLSLCFRQGNDSTIKTYLAGRLAEFKTANSDLHEKLRRTLLSLEKALRDNSNMNSELVELRENNSRTLNQLKAEYALEIAHEKEKALQEYSEIKERLEKERADLENRLHQQAEMQQDCVADLEKQLCTLRESKYALEMKVAELGTRLTLAEKDLDEKTQEYKRVCMENRNLDAEKHESSKSLNQHLIRLGALEQEVQDKNELIVSLTKQLEGQTSQRAALELSLKDAQSAAERAEEKSAANVVEVNKCNQLIEKLQAEHRSCKAKMKLKGQVTSQQDSLLLERQAAIDKALQENKALQQELAGTKLENDSLKKKEEEMRGKFDEAQELQKSNQQMIQWLNQQLTDAQLGKYGSASISSRYMYRPSLSFLSSSDSASRGTSNHIGISFPSSGSLNGALSCTGYKSMFALNSPFGQSVQSKSTGASQSNGPSGNISVMTSKSNTVERPGSHSSSPMRSSSGTLKVQYRPPHLNKSNSAGSVGGSVTPTNLASVLDKAESVLKPENSSQWAPKLDDVPWTILPRPPLSFVDARYELINGSGKNQENSYDRNGFTNGDKKTAPSQSAAAGSFSAAVATR